MKKMLSLLAGLQISVMSIAQVPLTSDNYNSYAPTLTGTGASGSWSINAASASFWGGRTANLDVAATDLQVVLGKGMDEIVKPIGSGMLKNFLGIPSTGETLQSVADRGNITTKPLRIVTAGSTNGLNLTNNVDADLQLGVTPVGAIYRYAWLQSSVPGRNLIINPDNSGNVGIGTTSPAYKLEVNGVIASTGNSTAGNIPVSNIAALYNGLKINGDIANGSQNGITYQSGGGGGAAISFYRGGGFETGMDFYTNSEGSHISGNMEHRMRLTQDGSLGIGTITPGSYKLAVEGTIGARKIKVTQSTWADYVFDSSYQLAPLHQVEKYIQANKHLPEVPSAKEVKKEGLDLGDNQALLLKKIEELTLYIIEQNKEIESLAQKVEKLEARK